MGTEHFDEEFRPQVNTNGGSSVVNKNRNGFALTYVQICHRLLYMCKWAYRHKYTPAHSYLVL